MIEYSLRRATENDFGAILSLINDFATFIKTPEKVSVTLSQMIEDKDLFNCLIAENENSEIIGFATYFFTYYSWVGKCLYLDDLYVSPSYRGKLIGSRLINMVFYIAKDNNCKKVRWQVSNWNKNAISFYEKLGAQIDTVEINCDLHL